MIPTPKVSLILEPVYLTIKVYSAHVTHIHVAPLFWGHQTHQVSPTAITIHYTTPLPVFC